MRQIRKTVNRFGTLLAVATLLGLVLHIGLIAFESLIIDAPVQIDLKGNIWRAAFSFPLLPTLVIEIINFAFILYLWLAMKDAIMKGIESEVERGKYETAVRTAQKLMALIAQHITTNNNQILAKIETRRIHGRPVSAEIEEASKRISLIVAILGETSFVSPHQEGRPEEKEDLVGEFERRIGQLKTS